MKSLGIYVLCSLPFAIINGFVCASVHVNWWVGGVVYGLGAFSAGCGLIGQRLFEERQRDRRDAAPTTYRSVV